MNLPQILYITPFPASRELKATMVHTAAILERFGSRMTWYSLRQPHNDQDTPTDIPYQYGQLLKRPSRGHLKTIRQYLNLGLWSRHLGNQAAKFGAEHQAEIVWADLAFETVIAGRQAARRLGVPLVVSIHDDPITRISHKNYPRWLERFFAVQFARTMRTSVRCGVISKTMGELYHDQYDVNPIVLYVGAKAESCLPPRPLDLDKSPIIIGSVGSVVSEKNWHMLTDAIRLLNQKYGENQFRILHIGELSTDLKSPEVEVTGWVTDEIFRDHLARTDINYLNIWFEPEYEQWTRASFPTKVHSYIEAQRPMIAFGPAYSSIARFIDEHQCGITCIEPRHDLLAASLERFLIEQGLYADALNRIQKVKDVFSREAFYEAFETFILSGLDM